ncbi:MAG: YbhB/YbcL family Raf kinase inhibitor-like protein [Xenococcaceae cyanobacterium]
MLGRRIFLKRSTSIIWLAGLPLIGCTNNKNSTITQSQTPISTMKLESTAFVANGLIPAKYTCDSQDISPPLSWSDPPADTQSFALICDDPDAPGRTFVHWVLYNLPAETRQLPENVPSEPKLSGGGVHGRTDFGKLGYGGPCPPRGTHRYFFKLYALNRQLDLEPGATKGQVEAAKKGHILASTEIIGRYARQR